MAKKLDDIIKGRKAPAKASPKSAADEARKKKMANIAAVCANLQKKFGAESVNFLGNKKMEPMPRFSSGSVSLDRIMGGGYPLGRMIEIFGPASSGKCLVKETRVLTANGYRTIGEIFRENGVEPDSAERDVPISYPLVNMDGEIESTTHFVVNGIREAYRVRTAGGREITGTAKHPLRTLVEGIPTWKQIGVLEAGDMLIGLKDEGLQGEDRYFNDSVESVERIGEVPVFDFAMSRTHSFIAEGIISHNTTLCYHAIAEAQRQFPDKWCGFVDSEHSFDPSYASNIGVDVSELMVAQPDSGTDAFGMVQGFIENGASLVVIDSVAAMVPREEMEEEDYGKNSIGLQARMMSKGLRKLTSIAGKYKCTLIFTNQTRNKVGVLYGSPEVTTGGKALEYYASIRLRVSQCGKVEDTVDGEKMVTAIETKVATVKNKVFAPFKNAILLVEFGKGIDNDAAILDIAIGADFIHKKGGWYAIGGENVAQGLVNLKRYLEAHPDVYDRIRRQVEEHVANDGKEQEVFAGDEAAIDAESMTDDEIAARAAEDDTEAGEV